MVKTHVKSEETNARLHEQEGVSFLTRNSCVGGWWPSLSEVLKTGSCTLLCAALNS